MIKLGQRGDTIVEVLIAIAVVSGVLGITYSIMNRNVQNVQDNQERTAASKIAQGQLELLRDLWARQGSLDNINDSCLKLDGSNVNVFPAVDLDSRDHSDDCKLGDNELYRTKVEKISRDPDDEYTYRVTVAWDRIGGGESEVVMAYRLQ